MQKIHIDMPALLLAWEDESPDNLYYLDTRTGAVKLVHQHLLDLRDLTDEIEKNRERFLYIPKPDRNQTRLDLRAFLPQVETARLRPILEVAFESPHVFMAFKKILASEPKELASFQSQRENLIQGRIAEWLEANNYVHDASFVNALDEMDDENDESDDYLDEDFDDSDGFQKDEENPVPDRGAKQKPQADSEDFTP